MAFRWMKTFVPRGIYGRAALILIVPIITIQLVVSIVFIQRHYEAVTRQMTENIVLEVDYLLQQVDASRDLETALRTLERMTEPLALTVTLPAPEQFGDARLFYDLSGRAMIDTFRDRLPETLAIDLERDKRRVHVLMDTRFGPMLLVLDRGRVSASNPHQLLVLMIVTSLLMTGIAYLFLRNQMRPIARLAKAAEAFGKGRSLPYTPRGAAEVRAAGSAFLDMRRRIERAIEQRTLLLSGVSHDLRTPLTRLKLGLSMLDQTEDTMALLRDVADMERLLDAFLGFVRADALDEPQPTDPAALLTRVVEDAQRSGQDARIVGITGRGEALLRPQAVHRALENLVGNALRYAGRAEVSLVITPRDVRLTVEDDGPGIPSDRREEAMRPFTRLDEARNQDLGSGVGLGLAIVQDVARSHGGSLSLADSERLGGLKAVLIFPR